MINNYDVVILIFRFKKVNFLKKKSQMIMSIANDESNYSGLSGYC